MLRQYNGSSAPECNNKKKLLCEYLSARKCRLGGHLKSQHHISNIHKRTANVMSGNSSDLENIRK